jgi:hypothetical protein
MKKNIQALLGAILIVAFASPSKSEEQFFGFGVEISKRSELMVSIAILIVEANKPMEGK